MCGEAGKEREAKKNEKGGGKEEKGRIRAEEKIKSIEEGESAVGKG